MLTFGSAPRSIVQRTLHTQPSLTQHVGVDHRRGHASMPEQLLDLQRRHTCQGIWTKSWGWCRWRACLSRVRNRIASAARGRK